MVCLGCILNKFSKSVYFTTLRDNLLDKPLHFIEYITNCIYNFNNIQLVFFIVSLIINGLTLYLSFVSSKKKVEAWSMKQFLSYLPVFFRNFIIMIIVSYYIRGCAFSAWNITMDMCMESYLCYLYIIYSTWLPVTYLSRIFCEVMAKYFVTPNQALSIKPVNFSLVIEINNSTFHWTRAAFILLTSVLIFTFKCAINYYVTFVNMGFESEAAIAYLAIITFIALKHTCVIFNSSLPHVKLPLRSMPPSFVPIAAGGMSIEMQAVIKNEHDLSKEVQKKNAAPIPDDVTSILSDSSKSTDRKGEELKNIGGAVDRRSTAGWQRLFWANSLNDYFRNITPYHEHSFTLTGLSQIKKDLSMNWRAYHEPIMSNNTDKSVGWFLGTLERFPYRQVGSEELKEMTRYEHCVHAMAMSRNTYSAYNFKGYESFSQSFTTSSGEIKHTFNFISDIEKIFTHVLAQHYRSGNADASWRRYCKQFEKSGFDSNAVYEGFPQLYKLIKEVSDEAYFKQIMVSHSLSDVLVEASRRLSELEKASVDNLTLRNKIANELLTLGVTTGQKLISDMSTDEAHARPYTLFS